MPENLQWTYTKNLKMRWVLLIFAFASCSKVAGQWCCAQIRPTSPGSTLLSCWCSVRDEVGTGSWSSGTVYWAYVTLWGGYFALISKWQDTHQKIKSLVYSHRTGRGLRCVVVLSPGSTLNWRVGEEEGSPGVTCNFITQPTFPMLVTLQVHSGHWRHGRMSVPVFEEPIFSGVADSLLCAEHEKNQLVYLFLLFKKSLDI